MKYGFKFGLFVLVLTFISSFLFQDSVENLQTLMENAKNSELAPKILIICGLLIIDSFVSVPTLLITYTTGYLLPPLIAFFTCLISFTLTFLLLYGLSYRYGESLLKFIIKNKDDLLIGKKYFSKNYFKLIIFSRFIPLLPEISFCLCGTLKIPLKKLILPFILGTVPYILFAIFYGLKFGKEEFTLGAIIFYASYLTVTIILKVLTNYQNNLKSS